MCLAVPGKIITIDDDGLFRMAETDFLGVRRRVCVDTVDARPGDYIIAHAGLAISVMDSSEAEATLRDLNLMTDLRDQNFNRS